MIEQPVDHLTQDTEEPLVVVHAVTRVYQVDSQQVHALRGISLSIPAGQLIALQGRSGSGKTTLLNCLGGLDRPTTGTVRVMGRDLGRMPDEELTAWRRSGVGFIFQSFGLLPTLSAFENIELVLRIAGANNKTRHARARECLKLVGLERWGQHRPYELSGGQQQRVSIARALANRPPLILADEPTGELDSYTAREILSLFRRIVEREKVTLIVATHDALVREYADVVYQLSDGQLGGAGK